MRVKEEEEILLDILEEVKASGAASDNGFKASTYHDIEVVLAKVAAPGSKKSGKANAKDNKAVENHWKIMKAAWREVRGIVAQSGFGWNAEEGCIEAETAVWEAYVEKNPKARKWRKKGLCYYVRVDELCSEAVATGEFALEPALGSTGEAPDEIEDDEAEERAAPSTAPQSATKRRGGGSDQFDRMIDILTVMAQPEAGPFSNREEDPIDAATRLLLELDADSFDVDEVAVLVSHFVENYGAARAYVTLAASKRTGTEQIREAYLRRVLSNTEP
ncbi:unnamed protein product [Tilletia controversa]|nr:hypothetical protein CF336_g9157 [Tilletia laevis]KAE8181780.1 hypothetical protein CF335_g8822 [Tilletia laevis]CAD6943832.1 unnamed protein product [Tilletia controversa]CAD6963947.1 unnamed protein product [Tilletia caries]